MSKEISKSHSHHASVNIYHKCDCKRILCLAAVARLGNGGLARRTWAGVTQTGTGINMPLKIYTLHDDIQMTR